LLEGVLMRGDAGSLGNGSKARSLLLLFGDFNKEE
jgi:hypothetical protein